MQKPKKKAKKKKAKAAEDSDEQDEGEENEEDAEAAYDMGDNADEDEGGKMVGTSGMKYRQEDYKKKGQVGVRQCGHPKRQICTITHSTSKRYKVAEALIKALEDGTVTEGDAKKFVASELNKP